MARREGVKNIGLQLTSDEFDALAAFAKSINRDKSVVIRAALAGFVPSFPGDAWAKDERWQERGTIPTDEKIKKS